MNPNDAMRELLKQKYAETTGKQVGFLNWAQKVPEPKGPLDFDRYPFQRELYSQQGAMDAEQVIKKATQLGISAFLLRWALYHADTRRQNALYVFPKRQQMYDFADARIKAAIQASPYLKKRIPNSHVANKGLKQIGLGWLYARGSESKDDLDSVDADVLCLDEYDTLRQENIPDAERRISGSRNGLIRRVGVPSLPGYGIDKLYEQSDQRRWTVKCGACGEQQYLDFKGNVDTENKLLICWVCHKPIPGEAVAAGEWVAKYPDRSVKGYHMPRLIVPNLDLTNIVKASEKTSPSEVTVHHNKDLAAAYAPEEGRLSDAAIDAASRDDLPREAVQWTPSDVVTMGVDVGGRKNLSVRVSNVSLPTNGLPSKRCLYMGEVDSFEKVSDLMLRYGVNMAVVDHAPEERSARALAERYPARVYLGHFITHRSATAFKVDPDARMAGVKRTEILDATFDMIRQQRNLLPMEKPAGWAKEMQALNRQTSELADGGVRGEYVSVAKDDYAFAEAYDVLALQVWLWHQNVDVAIEGTTTAFEDEYEWEPSDFTSMRVAGGQDIVDHYEAGFDNDLLDSWVDLNES